MSEDNKKTGMTELEAPRGPFVYRVYCHEDGCRSVSDLVNSIRPCGKCGSGHVNIQRTTGEVDNTSPVPFYMRGVSLPDGGDIIDLFRKMGEKKKPGMKKIKNALGLSRDEVGEEF